MRAKLCILFFSLIATLALSSATAAPFEFREGDRVLFLGDTLMEREQYHGYIELALATHAPSTKVTFRNLGWSADTPDGASRFGLSLLQAGHEPADEGWKQLLAQIDIVKPTVVFLGYGMANSFEGEEGLPKFLGHMNKLIDALLAKNAATRFVIFSPIRHERLSDPLPDPAQHNFQLLLYTEALRKIAAQRNFHFVSLFDDLKIETETIPARPLTDNGIHLNALGYQRAAEVIEKSLGWKPNQWKRHPNARALRLEILKKNEIFFNRSRPQNIAYIYGFRKYEQGKNAAEIPLFDPLAEAKDHEIFQLLQDRKAPKRVQQTTREPSIDTRPSTAQQLPEFTVAPGLEISLFAESPMLAKPVQMNFDPQGRLWVACSAIYPQIEPNQPATDKIIVLEDKNGDGKADTSTTFADGLLIPTAVVPGDGGVYVGQSTDLLHFKDTNNDGKADEQRRVLSGFGTEDSHHNIHTLTWGPDGHLYFNQSIYIRTDSETPNGVLRLKSGGVLKLQPRSLDFETLLYGFCNSWGHIFDEYGQSFTTDGCGGQGISYGIRSATYLTFAGMRREFKSISPGSYPKFCGLEVLRSEHFPPEWQNSLITSDFRAHRVVRFKVTEDGAGYAAQEQPELLRTTNTTFRPIDARVGPDGAIYIADWSNPIINHGEVDFRDPRRDHVHGRIWRVTFKGRPLLKNPKLHTRSNSDLLDQLLSPNDFHRNHSRRLLTERGNKIKADLEKWTWRQTDDKALLEALWLYESLSEINPYLLKKVAAAKDGRIRAAAVRVAGSWTRQFSKATTDAFGASALEKIGEAMGSPQAEEMYGLMAAAVRDAHPRVRLEAVRALAKIPSARSAELVLSALNQPMDNFLDYGIWLSINDLAQPWMQAVQSGAWKADGREKQLEFGLKALPPAVASSILEKALVGRTISREGSGPWIELIAQSGGTSELKRLFDQLLKGEFNDAAIVRVLNALEEAARLRNLKPGGNLEAIRKFIASGNDKISIGAIKLTGTWNLKNATEPLLKAATAKSTSPEVRNASFESLRQIGGANIVKALLQSGDEQEDFAIRKQAIVTAAMINLDDALTKSIELAVATTNEAASLDLWRALLGIKNSGPKIARALPKELPISVAKSALKVAREGGRNESELVLSLSRSANLDEADKALTPEELKQLAGSIAGKGNPAKGETLYRSPELACATCHAIGGAGGKVGPDLTSIGASAPVDYLIESLLYPNKKIKEGYHSIVIATKDEQEYSGIMVRETDTEVVLRDASNKEVSIARNNIDSRKNGLSLMPSGLVEALAEEDRTDLFRFLTELGKPGPFDASKGNVARAWKVFVMTARDEQFDAKISAGDPTVAGWMPLNSTVEGKLLKHDLQSQIEPKSKYGAVAVFALANLQLATATNVNLKISGAEKPAVWIDGKPVAANSSASVELAQGKHRVVIRVEAQALPEHLRLETSEGTFLVD